MNHVISHLEKVKTSFDENPLALSSQAFTPPVERPASFPCLMGNISNTYILKKPLPEKVSPWFEVVEKENPLAPPGQEKYLGFVENRPHVAKIIETLSGVQVSSQKLFACGGVWELYDFQDVNGQPVKFQYGYSTKEKEEKELSKWAVWAETELEKSLLEADHAETSKAPGVPYTDEQKAEGRKRDRAKSIKTFRRVVNLNKLRYMYSPTFALELNEKVKGLWRILPEERQRDRRAVQKVWNSFLTSFRRKLSQKGIDFKFVRVWEKHDSAKTDPRKRGTYHPHIATDKPIDKDFLQEAWGYGVVWIDDFNKKKIRTKDGRHVNVQRAEIVNDPGRYMAKYMEKDFDEAESYHQKAWAGSRNLEKPKPIRDETTVKTMLADSHAADFLTFDKTFKVEYKTRQHDNVSLFVRYRVFNFRILRK